MGKKGGLTRKQQIAENRAAAAAQKNNPDAQRARAEFEAKRAAATAAQRARHEEKQAEKDAMRRMYEENERKIRFWQGALDFDDKNSPAAVGRSLLLGPSAFDPPKEIKGAIRVERVAAGLILGWSKHPPRYMVGQRCYHTLDGDFIDCKCIQDETTGQWILSPDDRELQRCLKLYIDDSILIRQFNDLKVFTRTEFGFDYAGTCPNRWTGVGKGAFGDLQTFPGVGTPVPVPLPDKLDVDHATHLMDMMNLGIRERCPSMWEMTQPIPLIESLDDLLKHSCLTLFIDQVKKRIFPDPTVAAYYALTVQRVLEQVKQRMRSLFKEKISVYSRDGAVIAHVSFDVYDTFMDRYGWKLIYCEVFRLYQERQDDGVDAEATLEWIQNNATEEMLLNTDLEYPVLNFCVSLEERKKLNKPFRVVVIGSAPINPDPHFVYLDANSIL